MLTIGFDGTAALRQEAGIGRYARELLTELVREPGDDRFKVIASMGGSNAHFPDLGEQVQWYGLPVSDRLSNAFWHRARVPLPVETRLGRIDVFHSPDFSLAPSLAPAIVTVHDLTFEVMPQLSFPTLAAYLHRVVPRSIKRARAVIAPSESTKQAIVKTYGTDEAKVHVIAEGVSPSFNHQASPDDAETLGRLGLNDPFILAVGTLEPRKNLERLLDAFAVILRSRVPLLLVLAGQKGWLYEGIFERHQALGLGDAVRFLGNTADDDLQALYRRAEVTVYPSLYEGFGLPALEALACGSPLACSGNSSVPEVTDKAAVYFDPWDVDDMASTILQLLQDDEARRSLRSIGPNQAAKFTWRRAAENTMRLYHDVARG